MVCRPSSLALSDRLLRTAGSKPSARSASRRHPAGSPSSTSRAKATWPAAAVASMFVATERQRSGTSRSAVLVSASSAPYPSAIAATRSTTSPTGSWSVCHGGGSSQNQPTATRRYARSHSARVRG